MFGYISINKPELKVRDFDTYHAFYCGLCHTLGDRLGWTSRLTLTYDMTFLAILLDSLYEETEEKRSLRCPVRPWQCPPAILCPATRYAADMNVLLAFYNLADDWKDDHRADSRIRLSLLKNKLPGIRSRWPRQAKAVTRYVHDLHPCEQADVRDPDLAARLTGTMLGEIFVRQEDCWSDRLRGMGSALGRFIYLMDAYEDLPMDLIHGSYNPWKYMPEKTMESDSRILLTMMMTECCHAFEQLPILRNAGILRNVLYSGVWTAYERVLKTRLKTEETHHDGSL